MPAGEFELDGQHYFLSITPNAALSNISSALCVPAWAVKCSDDAKHATMEVAKRSFAYTVPDVEA